ncbi:MAG TPA: hypothetical protein VMF08_06405 [Candidatus Sulfotelmatobacter sp.]|nr:hypothetical protein [Candidatus Sulfotelmatobacter sp.]
MATSSGANLPFQTTVVVTPETTEIYDIENKANALLQSRQFDQLDAMAQKFLDTKACYADGKWKLFYLFNGLDFPPPANTNAPLRRPYYFTQGFDFTGEAYAPDWTNRLALLREWVEAKPNSATAPVALAKGLVDYAWQARGHDYANGVTEMGWKLFFQRLNEAGQILKNSKTAEEICPEWWAVALRVELGLQSNRNTFDTTFEGATRAFPDFAEFYFWRADYLLPRWYGSDGELERDLEKSTNAVGGEAGDMLYARVVWFLHHWVPSNNLFQEYGLSWERTNKGLQDLEKQYPDSLALENEAAHLAVIGRDRQAAKEYFDQTGGKIDLSAWVSADSYTHFSQVAYGPVH